MSDHLRRVRIFVGGPADVSDERNAVIALIRDELSEEFPELHLDPFAFDDHKRPTGFDTRSKPQTIVNQASHPSTCDIAVMIFKWRFGSEADIDGKEVPSASAWELETALESPRKPTVAIFRHREPFRYEKPVPKTQEEFTQYRREVDEGEAQYRQLDDFFKDLDRRYGGIGRTINRFRDLRLLVGQVKDVLRRDLKALEASHATKPEHWDHETPHFLGYPFPGLSDFGYAHHKIFFGRTDEIDTLVDRLRGENSPRLLIIHGDSGVGKSSLLKAGLLPRLTSGGTPGTQVGPWRHVTFEPREVSANPFDAFASAVMAEDKHGLILQKKPDLARDLFELCARPDDTERVRSKLEALTSSQLLQGEPEATQLVIAVNQMEELLDVAEPYRVAFINLIAIMADSPRVRFLCTLRDDAMARFDSFTPLQKALRSDANPKFPLTAPHRNQLEDMILGPAGIAGISVERRLVSRILDDALSAEEGALPLVAYTLQTMRLEHGDSLTLDAYNALGGLAGAVGNLAARASSKTSGAQLESLFERLAERRHGVLSRRFALRSQIESSVVPVIEELDRQRLLRSTVHNGEPAVQLAHQVLFQAWPDLKSWVEKSEAKLKLRDEVERDAASWTEGGRRLRLIKLRGERLDEIRAIAATDATFVAGNPQVADYIAAAELQRQREKLIASINGGHLTGIADAMKAGGKLETEDCHRDPGGVRPQFWAAVTGDDRKDPAAPRDGRSDQSNSDHPDATAESIFDDVKLINSTVSRGVSVPHLVALCGHLDLLKRLAAKEPGCLGRVSEAGITVLSAAAFGGHLATVKYLLEDQKLDANTPDEDGCSAAFWAYQRNHHSVVVYLSQQGATIELESKEGWTLLTEAARYGNVAEVRSLLRRGVPVDSSTKSGYTALFVACQYGHAELARVLVESGASPNRQNAEGLSPLHATLWQDDPVLIDVMIGLGCTVDITSADGVTPLHLAAVQGKAEFVGRLLGCGAKWSIADRGGFHPLVSAAANGYGRVVQALLAAGEDVNRVGPNKWTALHYACDDGDAVTTRILLEQPRITLNARENAGWTPLMLASRKDHADVARLLVEAGANRSALNPAGDDALALAIRGGSLPVVKELLGPELALDRNLRVISASMGLNGFGSRVCVAALPGYPNANHLSLAVAQGDLEIVRTLLAAGADVQLSDNLGDTALHHAGRLGYLEIAALLLRNGALVSVSDKEGRTPTDLANDTGNTAVAELLVSEGATEPAAWRRQRVSEEAGFLTFETVPEQAWRWLQDQFMAQGGFVLSPERMVLRAAPLLFYRDVYLIAAEDPNRRGLREQFALARPGEGFVMLDWTNEPIYNANELWGLHLDNDEAAIQYSLFFFHFVRGKLGRFLITSHVEEIRWNAEVTDGVRLEVAGKLEAIRIISRATADQVRLSATVVFKNALFRSAIVAATKATHITDEDGNEERFTIGQLKLTDEILLQEELPIEIDGPPGLFG